ncbi:zinc finger protein 729-like isoform X2 [Pectinophora gossypiella]|uniref:zinc finger protein 729-like isoform X2 n=1 Tax=Pectinophora gossypiella TaxID=13191 RepID=UPI00214E1588|nr:zinc finger protein 729-like isoform X2 [Pectinophora gossypiella]
MEDNPVIELRKLCCTCLSTDRKVIQLCKIHNGVNNLYLLLSYDAEAYKEGFYKDSASLYICWECRAHMRRVVLFRQQVCTAQKLLSCIAEGRTDTKTFKSLSHLTHDHKSSFDHSIAALSPVIDNFIDCNAVEDIKTEIEDPEDVPLSQLNGHGGINNSFMSEEDLSKKDFETEETPLSELTDNFTDEDYTPKEIITNKKPKRLKKKGKIKKKTSKKGKDVGTSEDLVEDSSSLGVVKCEPCAEVFRSSIELEEHNIAIHSESQRRTTAVNPGSKPRRNPTMMDKPTPYGYQCMECAKYFDNKNQRWKHVQRVHREGYRCHSCGKRFAFKNNLTRHEQLHAGPPPREECPVCHKMIRTDLVKVHARIHTARERYKCSMCDKGYRSRGELRDHENYQHKGETQHKCPICGKGLATRRCITRHVRRAHDGIKESARDKICQQCGKAFRDKKGLREHEWIHTGERPLSCSECGCSFRQSASLYTHRKRVHHIHTPKKLVTNISQ